MSKNLNTIAAILAGAAVGAGIGILFAPDKGSKTRAKLKEGFDDAKYNLKDSLEAGSEVLREKFSHAKQNLDGTYDELLSNMSYKTEEVISFLETKLADLKAQNAKLQK
ncbi:YtxH domain-containing protein [Flavobacterium sp. MC2016-06]|jgi:gas vesicle protein|uniref:YtxH domain-containing protein n=1 Tax=Flavobacterium sp. MC2016-06 TaxID=2676308 RepID=UPI0012BAA2C7|nr:YtxH domain-containing protein [Flavobacterium sp. MC2016-06]MBU3858937.1 YtxH domain-containing protein [Flavobacterium sp. MC2016-06]